MPFSGFCIPFVIYLHIYCISAKGDKIGKMEVYFRRNQDALCAVCNIWVLLCIFLNLGNVLVWHDPLAAPRQLRPSKQR